MVPTGTVVTIPCLMKKKKKSLFDKMERLVGGSETRRTAESANIFSLSTSAGFRKGSIVS
jgi:hypothetical protein